MFGIGPSLRSAENGPSAEDLEAQPPQGPFWQWVTGLAVPLIIGYHGLHAIITRQVIYGRDQTIPLTGRSAVAAGISSLAIALFLHCHFFWGNIYDNAWPAQLGKIAAVIVLIIAIGYLLIRAGVDGIVG